MRSACRRYICQPGPWAGSLLFGLRGQTLYRVVLTNDPRKVATFERLPTVNSVAGGIAEGPDGNLYLLTATAMAGSPKDDDDRVIRSSFK
jgi:hypothetical protein